MQRRGPWCADSPGSATDFVVQGGPCRQSRSVENRAGGRLRARRKTFPEMKRRRPVQRRCVGPSPVKGDKAPGRQGRQEERTDSGSGSGPISSSLFSLAFLAFLASWRFVRSGLTPPGAGGGRSRGRCLGGA